MTDRAPCVRCGRILHTGDGRVLVSFTAPELVDLMDGAATGNLYERLRCALSLIDEEKAREFQ